MNVFYYSNRSKPCEVILQKLEQMPHIRSTFQYVSIDTQKPQHPIRSVPAAIVEGKQYEGKQVFDWLASETNNNTLPPFEQGFGTNNFTSIHNNDSPAESNRNFTYIEDDNVMPQQQKNSVEGGKKQKIKDDALDDLINQRKLDIPIPRQRA